ncbi:MAG TPA: DUF488 domain-containing protein [Acidobacteriaceae bacterium]|nr:DUF488 domain-containing protein [Acidobacteriaceae bacterium]
MLTIGHSTLPIESFLRAVKENGCNVLVDVRRYPGSRRHPQFGQQELFSSLAQEGIRGVWREGLGGRRAASHNSINTGWKNEGFRGYADYMQTPAFAAHLDWLLEQERSNTVVIMCAESLPWRCHRSLISDAVLARNGAVEDIFVQANGTSSRKPHILTPFAHVENGRVFYPGLLPAEASS